MNLDTALLEVGIPSRIVDELRNLALTHLGGTVTKYEEKGIDRIGLSRTIGPDNGGEGLGNGKKKKMRYQRKNLHTLWKGPISCRPA